MPGIPGMPPLRPAHLAHHLLRLGEPLEQLVDVADLDAGAPGDALPARAVEDLRLAALLRGHRRMIASMRSISRSSKLSSCSRISPMPGQHAEHLLQRAHVLQGRHLREEVLEREVLVGGQLGRHLLGLVGVERLLGLLDQGEHVAHVEDARRHPVGVEELEVLQLLAGGGEHDRPAGDADHRQRGTTAGVAVELGQHDAGEADAVEERLRGGHRVLADHRVDDEQRSRPGWTRRGCRPPAASARRRCRAGRRCRRSTTSCCLSRACATPSRATCDRVAGAAPGAPDPSDAVPGCGANTRDPGPLADDLQLGHGVRALQVGRRPAAGCGPARCSQRPSLPASVVLPAPCRPASMITVGGFLASCSRRVSPPRMPTSSSLTILTTCCAGLSACETSTPSARSRTPAVNCAHDRQRDVGVEQRPADLAHRRVDVGLGQPALAAQGLERRGQAVGEGGEHGACRVSGEPAADPVEPATRPRSRHADVALPRDACRRPPAPRRPRATRGGLSAAAAGLGQVEHVDRLPGVGGHVRRAQVDPDVGQRRRRARAAARAGRRPAPRARWRLARRPAPARPAAGPARRSAPGSRPPGGPAGRARCGRRRPAGAGRSRAWPASGSVAAAAVHPPGVHRDVAAVRAVATVRTSADRTVSR